MNHFALIAVLFVVLSFVVPMLFRLFGTSPRDRAKGVVEYAQRRGFALVNPVIAQAMNASLLEMAQNPALRNSVRAASDIADIDHLANGTGDWLAFNCTVGSKEATIFNLSVTPQSPRNAQSVHYKVAKIKASGLPRFSLGKNSVLRVVDDLVGKLTGTPNAKIEVDVRQFPEFTKHYWLRGTDPAAVTAFVSSEKLRFIENTKPAGVLATNANYLVYYESGILRSDQDFDTFINQVNKLAAAFL
jgi:hypothetical protein